MTNWSLKFKNAATCIKRGGQFGIETGLKMCPMTVAPYFGYKMLRYGKQGVLEAADPVYQITDTHADIMEGQIINFHTEPLQEQSTSYKAFVYELGGYSQCTDYYKPYLGKENAMGLCRRIMLDTMLQSDSDTLKKIEMGAIVNTRKTVKDIIDEIEIDIPSIPDIPTFNIPSLPEMPDMEGVKKSLQVSALVIIGVVLLIVYMLTGKGKKGVTVVT